MIFILISVIYPQELLNQFQQMYRWNYLHQKSNVEWHEIIILQSHRSENFRWKWHEHTGAENTLSEVLFTPDRAFWYISKYYVRQEDEVWHKYGNRHYYHICARLPLPVSRNIWRCTKMPYLGWRALQIGYFSHLSANINVSEFISFFIEHLALCQSEEHDTAEGPSFCIDYIVLAECFRICMVVVS